MKFYDNTADTSQASAGTGDFILQGTAPAAALAAFRVGQTTLANNDVVAYLAVDSTTTATWELGYGTFTTAANHLTRNLKESSTGSLISFTNAANIYFVAPFGTLQTFDYYNQSAATVTPTLSAANGRWQELTNASCTGFHLPSGIFAGELFRVTNSTGADLATGDWVIGKGSSFTFGFNGTSWLVLSMS